MPENATKPRWAVLTTEHKVEARMDCVITATTARATRRPHCLAGRVWLAALVIGVVVVGVGTLGARAVGAESSASDAGATVYYPAKLKVLRAAVRQGRLEALLSITGRATGVVTVDYQAAGQFRRVFAPVGPVREGEKRIVVLHALTGRQRAVQTGIVNAGFAGDGATSSDFARVRAANGHSGLLLQRLTLRNGRLSVAGWINGRVSGLVRLRASYVDSDGSAALWTGRAAVLRGTWRLDEKLPAAVTVDPNAYLAIQFTGDKSARGGPYRGEQIGKSLGNLATASPRPPANADGQRRPDVQDDPCGDVAEDECGDNEQPPLEEE